MHATILSSLFARSLALFQCMQCGAEELSWNDRGKVNEPTKCPNPACQVCLRCHERPSHPLDVRAHY